jgi:3-phenylpropionate/trans-cinnamate dioxygenase ferredoxin reductase subunit
LSKEYLAGDKALGAVADPPGRLLGGAGDRHADRATVVAVDPDTKTVECEGGERIGYGQLVWAAGGAPRALSCAGYDLAGVHSVRSRADVDRMIAELPATHRVVVIGGGYIGLEARRC